jgi:hypothetical protein
MKRKRFVWPVCTSTADGQLRWHETSTLDTMLEPALRTMRRLGQRHHTARMLQWADHLGHVCLNSGHPAKAIDIWLTAISLARRSDEQWVWTPINTSYYSFDGLTHGHQCERLARLTDKAYRQAGFPQLASYHRWIKWIYRDLWAEKYNVCWDDLYYCLRRN